MKGNYRLTVHLDNVKKVQGTTGKQVKGAKGKMVDEKKSIIHNTLSFYCNTKDDCIKKLTEIKADPSYKIAKGKDYKKKHKYNKDLWQISFVN